MNKPPENSKRFVDVLFDALDDAISLDFDVDIEMLAAKIADEVFPADEYEIIWYEDNYDPDLKPGFYIIPRDPDDRQNKT